MSEFEKVLSKLIEGKKSVIKQLAELQEKQADLQFAKIVILYSIKNVELTSSILNEALAKLSKVNDLYIGYEQRVKLLEKRLLDIDVTINTIIN